jgi:hypothetical protein
LRALCSDGNELFGFQEFTEEEIEQNRQVHHFSGGGYCTALDEVEDELMFKSSSHSDDEVWDAMIL